MMRRSSTTATKPWRSSSRQAAQHGDASLKVVECRLQGAVVPRRADVLENLELTDLGLLGLCIARRQTRGFPAGTPIRGITVEE